MPYPQNLETAKEVEAIVRENGAVPATVAILDGVPCVGVYFILFFQLFILFLGSVKRNQKQNSYQDLGPIQA